MVEKSASQKLDGRVIVQKSLKTTRFAADIVSGDARNTDTVNEYGDAGGGNGQKSKNIFNHSSLTVFQVQYSFLPRGIRIGQTCPRKGEKIPVDVSASKCPSQNLWRSWTQQH
jgi:hypothetical protein